MDIDATGTFLIANVAPIVPALRALVVFGQVIVPDAADPYIRSVRRGVAIGWLLWHDNHGRRGLAGNWKRRLHVAQRTKRG